VSFEQLFSLSFKLNTLETFVKLLKSIRTLEHLIVQLEFLCIHISVSEIGYICAYSGHIAERTNMRYFLTVGMYLSGVTTVLFGFARYWNIHSLAYFVVIQVWMMLFHISNILCGRCKWSLSSFSTLYVFALFYQTL